MFLTTTAIAALLPALTSAQSAPLNTTSFGGYPSNQFAVDYYRASHRSNITNAVGFQGFNWTVPISNNVGESNTNASNTWQMHLNYSTVVVPSNSGNVTTGNTVLSMSFPGGPWSLDSDWRLCASFSLGGLSDSIASKGTNNSDGSCVPYLGQSCVDALMSAYRGASTSQRCPALPDVSSISECSGVANAFTGGGIGTAGKSFRLVLHINLPYPHHQQSPLIHPFIITNVPHRNNKHNIPRPSLRGIQLRQRNWHGTKLHPHQHNISRSLLRPSIRLIPRRLPQHQHPSLNTNAVEKSLRCRPSDRSQRRL